MYICKYIFNYSYKANSFCLSVFLTYNNEYF